MIYSEPLYSTKLKEEGICIIPGVFAWMVQNCETIFIWNEYLQTGTCCYSFYDIEIGPRPALPSGEFDIEITQPDS